MRFNQLASPVLAILAGSVAVHANGDSCPAPSSTAGGYPTYAPHPRPTGGSSKDGHADLEVDLVVVGGGSGGIHAAIALKDAGAKVVVIEKKGQIGGHAETFKTPDGTPINAGVVIFENTTVVSDYFARLKVPTTFSNPITDTTPGAPPTKSFDFTLGVPIPDQNATAKAASNAAFAAATQNYITHVLSQFPWVDEGYLVPDPVPADLLLPFGELAKKYSFEAILPVIAQLNWFAGDISTIPSLYGIKFFGPGLLETLAGKFIVSASGDTRSLYEAAAKELGDDVLLNATIVKLRRTDKTGGDTTSVKVVVSQPGQPDKTIRAKKILFAIPPTLANLAEYDVSGDESELLSKFQSLGYWASVLNIPTLTNSLANVGIQQPYNQPAIPGANGIVLSAPGYFIASVGFNDTYNEERGREVIRSALKKVAAAGGAPAGAADSVVFSFTSDHGPYSLRVSTEDIKAGFYKKLLHRQGQRNTWWGGAAFAGQNSGLVWKFNHGTVIPGLKKDLGLK